MFVFLHICFSLFICLGSVLNEIGAAAAAAKSLQSCPTLDVGGTLVLPLEWRRVCRGTS